MAQKTQAPHRRVQPPLLLFVAVAALVLIIVGVLIATAQPGTQGGSAAAPRLAAAPEKIDLGDVKVNDPVTARFVISNSGGQNLQIIGQPQVRVVEGC